MRLKILLIFLLLFITEVESQNNQEKIVLDFGEALSSWCKTNDIVYREKIDGLCSGVKKCRVEDKIHSEYQKKRGLTNYETYVLDSYLNMFESLISKSLIYEMNNVKVVASDEMPDGKLTFITADIKVSGPLNNVCTDLFLVRDNKITGIYTYSSKLGFSHLHGSLIQALYFGKYRWASSFQNGYAVVSNEYGKCGLIDIKGEVIIPCIWEHINYSGGSFATGTDLEDKTIVYDLRYRGKRTSLDNVSVQDRIIGREKKISTFFDGYALLYNFKLKKFGYLAENDITYRDVTYIYDNATRFSKGLALVKKEGKCYFINNKFQVVLEGEPRYEIIDHFYEGFCKVQDKYTGKYGFMNTEGNIVIPCSYDGANEFSEGVCLVIKYDEPSRDHNYKTFHYGVINKSGELIIPYIYEGVWSNGYEDGYLEVSNNYHMETLLGLDGKPLQGLKWYEGVRRFCNGLARYEENGRSGFINHKGEIVIPPIYEFALFFNNGYACVGKKINNKMKYGCINVDGIQVVPYIYDESFTFENGIALVKKENSIGLIDVYGNSTFLSGKSKFK